MTRMYSGNATVGSGLGRVCRPCLWLVAALAIGGVAGCNGSGPGLSGDGDFTDPTSTSRTEISFAPISLSEPGSYTFEFAGLLPADFHTLLAVEGASPEVARAIDRAGVNVRMMLVATTIASRPPKISVREGELEGQWSKTEESWNDSTLEYVGMWFRAARHERYTLSIDVRVDSPPGVSISAVPILRGGGFFAQPTGSPGSRSGATAPSEEPDPAPARVRLRTMSDDR